MDDTKTLKQLAEQTDRQMIAGEMTRILQDPASDNLTLEQIKRMAVANLKRMTAEINF